MALLDTNFKLEIKKTGSCKPGNRNFINQAPQV